MSNNEKELSLYLKRKELSILTEFQKKLMVRYCNIFYTDYPVGRRLAHALMCFNSRYEKEKVSQDFINWLYSY